MDRSAIKIRPPIVRRADFLHSGWYRGRDGCFCLRTFPVRRCLPCDGGRKEKTMSYPVIDLAATGRNIAEIRRRRGLSVRDLQNILGFASPQAIYKWQNGDSLPSVDHLVVLSAVFEMPIEQILVTGTVPEKK